MPKVPSVVRLLAALLVAAGVAPSASTTNAMSGAVPNMEKMDSILQRRAASGAGTSSVIIRGIDGTTSDTVANVVQRAGGVLRRRINLLQGGVAELPDQALAGLANNPFIAGMSYNRLIAGANERTGATTGSTAVRQSYGYDGSGVGVAIVDSGVVPTHDDLSTGSPRVAHFVDFVDGGTTPYDDYGHGTHVAGIIAGNGFDSKGARAGVAPGASLTVLKVLDASGVGRISDVIAAIDYVVDNKDALNIRVLNLSVAAAVTESYTTDPLTLATLRAVRAGIVVVAAAGNNARDAQGRTRHGGITAPGNAPWVLTVGASSHMGTTDRSDDVMAPFSSMGPGAIDYAAKPDLVAPGVGTESLATPESTLYSTRAAYLLPGRVKTAYLPYLSLSGTSMSAPVVAGSVALMLQANPSLTPNQVKAILQYTSEFYPAYDRLTQGAGFLNAKGAVELARYLASPRSVPYPDSGTWTRRLIWGNQMVKDGRLTSNASAWAANVVWGASSTSTGAAIDFGYACSSSGCSATQPWRLGVTKSFNVVWGYTCGGNNCFGTTWSATAVWGTDDEGDTVVWGTTDDGDTVVWGTADDGDTVVWGTNCSDPACAPVVWPR